MISYLIILALSNQAFCLVFLKKFALSVVFNTVMPWMRCIFAVSSSCRQFCRGFDIHKCLISSGTMGEIKMTTQSHYCLALPTRCSLNWRICTSHTPCDVSNDDAVGNSRFPYLSLSFALTWCFFPGALDIACRLTTLIIPFTTSVLPRLSMT